MADEQRPPTPIADEGSGGRSIDASGEGEGEAYSHWLNLRGVQRQSDGEGKSVAPVRPSTIEDHAKLKAAAKHQPPEPSAPEIVPDETDPIPIEAPNPSDALLPPAAIQDDLRMLMATLDHQSRLLTSLRADLEKTAKRRHLWVVGVILLFLIAGTFFLDPDSILTAIGNL